jgi:hypothetical protein
MNLDKDLQEDMGKDCYKTMRDLKHGIKLNNACGGMGILPKRLLDFLKDKCTA